MLIIPLNLDSVLLLLHNSKLAYWISLSRCLIMFTIPMSKKCAFIQRSPNLICSNKLLILLL